MEALIRLPSVAVPAAAFLVWICYKIFLQPNVLPDLPIVGLDKRQWFAWPRLLYRSFHSFRDIYSEAYENVRRAESQLHPKSPSKKCSYTA